MEWAREGSHGLNEAMSLDMFAACRSGWQYIRVLKDGVIQLLQYS